MLLGELVVDARVRLLGENDVPGLEAVLLDDGERHLRADVEEGVADAEKHHAHFVVEVVGADGAVGHKIVGSDLRGVGPLDARAAYGRRGAGGRLWLARARMRCALRSKGAVGDAPKTRSTKSIVTRWCYNCTRWCASPVQAVARQRASGRFAAAIESKSLQAS